MSLGGLRTVEDGAKTTSGLGGGTRSGHGGGTGDGGESLGVPGGGAGNGEETGDGLDGDLLAGQALPAGELAGGNFDVSTVVGLNQINEHFLSLIYHPMSSEP